MEKTSYQELLKKYQELELRVTRFSSTQQQLINVRDRLDQELEFHKKLQDYTGRLLNIRDENELLRMSAEAIVDILEIEMALIFVRYNSDRGQSILFGEGFEIDKSLSDLENDFEIIYNRDRSGGEDVFDVHTLEKCKVLSRLGTAISKCYKEPELGYEVFFLGGISKKHIDSYNSLEERHINIFLIFSQQMQSVLANRKRHATIESQFEKIKASEIELKKLSLIATRSNSGVIFSDHFGRVEWVNEAFTKITGYELHEVLGRKPKDFLHGPDTGEDVKQLLKRSLEAKMPVETVLVNYRKDGIPYFNELEIISVFDDAGKHTHFVGFQKDITEELQSRMEIIRMNSIFEALGKTSHTGIWEWNLENSIIQWNDILYEIMGVAKKTDRPVSLFEEWKFCIHPDDRQDQLENIEKLRLGKMESSRSEYRIIRKSDGSIRDCVSIALAVRDKKGRLVRLVGSMQDVTEQSNIQKDLIRKNEELQKINAELDHFVYSISHDLRSPLLSIKGLLTLVLKSAQLSDEHAKYIHLSLTSAGRLDNTIQEILEYSRNSRMQVVHEPFDIAELITTVFEDLKYASGREVKLVIDGQGNPVITSDKARMGVLLKNIIGNSIKYGRPEVDSLVKVSLLSEPETLTIVVEDNGEGIPEKHMPKVFDMFYRATSTVAGTGLGLYICKEIVAKLKGTISLDSVHGEGTTVTITIPLTN